MARYGQQLLRRLTFQYCDRMASSQGMREYIHDSLAQFVQRHPHVRVTTLHKRNHFPLVKAEYAHMPSNAEFLQKQLARQHEEAEQQRLWKQQLRRWQQQQLAGGAGGAGQGDVQAQLPGQAAIQAHQQQAAEQRQQQPEEEEEEEQLLRPPPPPVRREVLRSNAVGVKHYSAAQIGEVVWWLTQSQCRPKQRRIPSRHIVSKRPSIQGAWTATTF